MERGWLRCVTDSNLWLDLLSGGLEATPFRLLWEFMAPDVIILELLLPYSWNIEGLGLKEMSLSGSAVKRVEALVMKYPKYPGRRDLFALSLAIDEQAILLTGDDALRKAAVNEGIEAHGTLWLLQKMVSGGAITEGEAHAGLSRMTQANRRLPRKETQELLTTWDPTG